MSRPVPTLADFRRIVIKVGSSLLVDAAAGKARAHWLATLCEDIAKLHAGKRDILVVSSGAIALGRAVLKLARGPLKLEDSQAAAAVGQIALARIWAETLGQHGITAGQILVTLGDTEERRRYLNARETIDKLLEWKAVPVINENDTVATTEIRYGDNDRLAARVATMMSADLLVLLSDVDGLYDGDPRKPGARLITEVAAAADLDGVTLGRAGSAGVGTGGMSTKVDAARIATAAGIPVVLTSAPNASEALAGDLVGTHFLPTGRRASTRLLWLAHAATPRGSLQLDAGAVKAVVGGRKSLLPAGVTAVVGAFAAGDPVDLLDENGHAVARGLVNFDAAEIPGLLGRSTRELAAELGPAYEREIVHRDDLVLLRH